MREPLINAALSCFVAGALVGIGGTMLYRPAPPSANEFVLLKKQYWTCAKSHAGERRSCYGGLKTSESCYSTSETYCDQWNAN